MYIGTVYLMLPILTPTETRRGVAGGYRKCLDKKFVVLDMYMYVCR